MMKFGEVRFIELYLPDKEIDSFYQDIEWMVESNDNQLSQATTIKVAWDYIDRWMPKGTLYEQKLKRKIYKAFWDVEWGEEDEV